MLPPEEQKMFVIDSIMSCDNQSFENLEDSSSISTEEKPSGYGNKSADISNFLPPLPFSFLEGQQVIPAAGPSSQLDNFGYKIKCSQCKFETNDAMLFKLHQKQHAFQCPYCDRSAPHRSALEGHIRTHTREKPFKCPHCVYASSQKGNLVSHIMRIHASQTSSALPGAKKFQCVRCKYLATDEEDHLNHTANVHGAQFVFSCSQCTFRTLDRKDLIIHLKIHFNTQ